MSYSLLLRLILLERVECDDTDKFGSWRVATIHIVPRSKLEIYGESANEGEPNLAVITKIICPTRVH